MVRFLRGELGGLAGLSGVSGLVQLELLLVERAQLVEASAMGPEPDRASAALIDPRENTRVALRVCLSFAQSSAPRSRRCDWLM